MGKSPLRPVADGLVVIFLLGLTLRLSKPVLFPFVMAVFLYYLFSPLFDLAIRLKIPRSLALIVSILVAFTLLYFIGVLVYTSGKALATKLPSYGGQLNEFIQWVQSTLEKKGIAAERFSFLEALNINQLAGFILSSLGTFLSFLTKLLLILVFLFFMLAGRGKLKAKVLKSLETTRAENVAWVLDKIDREIQKYLVIKSFISLLSGGILTLILIIFRVDFALMFGLVTFFLNFIPSIGSIVAILLPSLYAVLQFGSLSPAIWIFLLLVGTDFTIANILEPRIMGKGLGLSPLAVLFSLFFWGWLWGIPGMILAVPVLAAIKIVADHFPSWRFLSTLLGR